VILGKPSAANIAYRGKYRKNLDKALLCCRTCGKRFASTQNTPLSGSNLSIQQVHQIIHHAAEGVSVRATARLLGLDKATVNLIIVKVGEHCQRIYRELMSSLKLTEVQLDESWTFVKKTSANQGELDQGLGELWIWTAIDSPTRLIVNYLPGRHSLEEARGMTQEIASSSGGGKPLFVSDGLAHYATVHEDTHGHLEAVPSTGKRGRPANPKWVVDGDLDYAIVMKTRRKGRIARWNAPWSLARRKAYGAVWRTLLAKPSIIERSNLDRRLWDAHLARKTSTFAKSSRWLKAKLQCIFWYNFVRPHSSLDKNSKTTLDG
jgi:transposase-like protein/IS1 family transposase